MPDIFTHIAQADEQALAQLVDVLERRAAEPQLRAMLDAYLGEVALPAGARLLEVGSGTGAVARTLAGLANAGSVVGVDPSPVFLAKARELGAGIDNLRFEQADGLALPFEAGEFDLVVLHTLLCHVPDPAAIVAEACRVLKPGATLAVFDCDFSTATLSTGRCDPFQSLAEALLEGIVHDRWFVRRMTRVLRSAGLQPGALRSYSYVEHPQPGFMYSWIERGSDALLAQGRIGEAALQGLRAEAERRVAAGEWFAHVAYASCLCTRPG